MLIRQQMCLHWVSTEYICWQYNFSDQLYNLQEGRLELHIGMLRASVWWSYSLCLGKLLLLHGLLLDTRRLLKFCLAFGPRCH